MAITLDTSIFDGNYNRFEHGLLARLKQFNNTSIDFVLSDVVLGEITSHLVRDASESQSKLKASIKQVSWAWQITEEQRKAAVLSLFAGETPEQLAKRRLDAFIKSAQIEIVNSEGRLNISTVLDAYFSANPPFGKSIAKKSEFPDAIALHALEHWAKEKKHLLLVVSNDGDWQRYCKTSPHLVASSDLANALSYFHQNAEVACARITERFNEGNEIEAEILKSVRDAVDRMSFNPTITSGYFYDAYVYDVDVTRIEIVSHDSDAPFQIVDKPEGDVLVVDANVIAYIKISSTFRFSITDPIDKDEVPAGSASCTLETFIDLKVLLTFHGDLSQNAQLVEVEVETDAKDIEIDYGDIGPDWDNEHDEDEH